MFIKYSRSKSGPTQKDWEGVGRRLSRNRSQMMETKQWGASVARMRFQKSAGVWIGLGLQHLIFFYQPASLRGSLDWSNSPGLVLRRWDSSGLFGN